MMRQHRVFQLSERHPTILSTLLRAYPAEQNEQSVKGDDNIVN